MRSLPGKNSACTVIRTCGKINHGLRKEKFDTKSNNNVTFGNSKFYTVSVTVSKNLRNLASLDIYSKILQESTYDQFEIRVNITFSLR